MNSHYGKMHPSLTAWAAVAVAALLVSKSLCQRKATPVYVGCFRDRAVPNRDLLGLVGIAQLGPFIVTHLSEATLRRDDMTVDLCSEVCTYGGFRYAAVQNHVACRCDSSYGSWGRVPESDCNMNCAGSSGQMCGEALRNSIYENLYTSSSNGLRFRKVAASAAPPLVTTAEFAGSLGWDRTAKRLADCAGFCARGSSCSAYRFNSSSGLCRLSSFATSFVNEAGDVWIVG